MVPVGVGFIGAGDVAYLHKLALLQIRTAKVVAVFDMDEPKSKNLASDLGARVCRSADELVNLPEIQVVYVLTPEPAHHENVMRSLRAGKHTFVEKPISFSREPILEWIELRKQKSCLCVPGHNYIHAPALRSMKKLIVSGQLGEIQKLWILFRCPFPARSGTGFPVPCGRS